jgi:adenine-specific DNA-methyltransferase
MPILHWLDRDTHTRAAEAVPYRLLEALPEHSAGDANTENMLIQGDNLEALKALLPYYAGRVKCIFIDPPYNTRSAFEHYDDNLEHSQWLGMMFPRLVLLRELLAEDGSIWVTIDDNEAHYLKVVMDEVFGRKNFIGSPIWQHSIQGKGYSGKFSIHHNYIFCYKKSDSFLLKDLERTEEHNVNYSNPDNDPKGKWRSGDVRNSLVRPNLMYDIESPSGKIIKHPPKGWRFSRETFERELSEGKIIFSADESRIIRKIYLADQEGRVPETIWFANDVGTTREASAEVRLFIEGDEAFDTPKPERLIQRILTLATNPHDLILDSFLGSGTTAAVAHKMNRRYIGIEMGDHALTHCVPRLKKVIDGEQGGISQAVGWQGGGGFRFYRLGETVFDESGQINPAIRFAPLAAHIWFTETRQPLPGVATSPLLGVHEGAAYYLLYNGILGDKRPDAGNVLTQAVLATLPPHDGPRIIYGEASRIGPERLKSLGIVFKQTPYDVKAR